MTEPDFLDPLLREQLLTVSTATLSSQLVKRGLRHTFVGGIAPVNPHRARMVGLAYTLRFIPMREDIAVARSVATQENPQRRAIEQIPEGHVLVIDARGVRSCGNLGDILASRLQVRGVAGVVSDGAMRDSVELETIDLPIFCAGFAGPPSYTGLMAADTQCAIGCGDVAVFPGDVIVTDRDGAVVLPRALAAEVATDALEQERIDRFVRTRIDAGSSIIGVYPPNEATLAEYRRWRDGEDAAL
jgi:regulator of RNase E activity RraA